MARKSRRTSACSWVVLGLLGLLGGCGGGGAATVPVAGKVTFGEAPIEKGQINFYPTDRDASGEVLEVVGGKFSGTVSKGPKRVSILGFSETGPEFEGKPSLEQFLPTRYNQETELTAEIPEQGDREMVFSLKK
ncbi:hypothetical protein Pan216_19090 [Planctomycetes bacterium Pan216]|uniref:Uncharacterized protein n=1 Tax=Kolteria novifilia TaxID=2527975 RepID=A0A518B298_9BACT|nr:hypothetical protein Pan216_19090 [Planctomycetes bacterium Pan216]